MGQQPCKTLHRKQASASSSGLGDKAKNKMVGKVMRDSWRSSLSSPFKDTVFPPLAASLLRLSLSLSLSLPPDASQHRHTGAQAHTHTRIQQKSWRFSRRPWPTPLHSPLIFLSCEEDDDRVSEASRCGGGSRDKGENNGFFSLALMRCPERSINKGEW
jgi:hypothetical protein